MKDRIYDKKGSNEHILCHQRKARSFYIFDNVCL